MAVAGPVADGEFSSLWTSGKYAARGSKPEPRGEWSVDEGHRGVPRPGSAAHGLSDLGRVT